MSRIHEQQAKSAKASGNEMLQRRSGEQARAREGIRRPARPCFIIALALLLGAGLVLWRALPAHSRQVDKGNATKVLTNVPSASESQSLFDEASGAAVADMWAGRRTRSTAQRFNSADFIKDAKLRMQMEANSEPPRPARTGAPAASVSEPSSDLKPSSSAAAPEGLLTYMELPSRIRESIPVFVTMLVYSSQPGNRSITINSVRLLQGEEVMPGLRVEEIVTDGAVFSYQGYHFHKGVIGD